jgi:hypothetical protein
MFPAIRHNLSLAGNGYSAQALFPAKSKNNIFAGSTMKSLSNQQRLHQVNTEQLFENYRSALGHAVARGEGLRPALGSLTLIPLAPLCRSGNLSGQAAQGQLCILGL